MIAHSPFSAPARLSTPYGPNRPARASTLVLVVAFVLGLPGLAHAAQGGVAVAGGASGSASATAKGAQAESPAAPTVKPRSVSKTQVRRAQTLLRTSVTGSNDVKTRKIVKRFQTLRGITAHGIIDVPTYVQIKDAFALLETGGTVIDTTDDAAPATGGGTSTTATSPEISLPANLAPITANEQAILDTIAQCESKGDPTATSSNGLYRGKYQFDKTTWKTVGGTGDPAEATELEQDQRAAILLRQRGTAPWPICGKSAAA